ncbi:MAG: hypothetical protein F4039_08980 [Gammaproteobacteria bacterium]|nr:hypothetical protein [Gammaproteobacteria bacterium]MYK44203.1 hypothetical protein [Gammaproteobacteria bacterium]
MIIPRQEFKTPDSPRVRAFYYCDAPEVLIYGARNTSKSFTIEHRLLTLLEMYPGFQALVCRLEYKSLGAVFSQLEGKILKYGLTDKKNPFVFKNSSKTDPRPHLLCDNRSKLCFGGLDNSSKLLGNEYDFVWVNEADRLYDMSVLGDLRGCMEGGRAGNWITSRGLKSQLVLDMNPSHKKHPLWMRVKNGTTTAIKFRHKDHPLFYCWETETWFQHGIDTVQGLLDSYPSGFDRERMVYGRFAAAEGLVFSSYSPEKHITDMSRDDFGSDSKWYYSCDWGGINASGIWCQTPDETLHLFKETYRKGESVEDTINRIKAIQKRYNIPAFDYGVIDHEIDTRFQLDKAGLAHKLADKDIAKGIETCKWAFSNGKVKINRHSLDDPDPTLLDTYQCLKDEIEAYVYLSDDNQTGAKSDNLPDKKCSDHAIDHSRYLVQDRLATDNWSLPPVLGTIDLLNSN